MNLPHLECLKLAAGSCAALLLACGFAFADVVVDADGAASDATVLGFSSSAAGAMVFSLQAPGGHVFPMPANELKLIEFGTGARGRRFHAVIATGEDSKPFSNATFFKYESGWFLAQPADDSRKYWVDEKRVLALNAAEAELPPIESGPGDVPPASSGFGTADDPFGAPPPAALPADVAAAVVDPADPFAPGAEAPPAPSVTEASPEPIADPPRSGWAALPKAIQWAVIGAGIGALVGLIFGIIKAIKSRRG